MARAPRGINVTLDTVAAAKTVRNSGLSTTARSIVIRSDRINTVLQRSSPSVEVRRNAIS
jgi:hypothetical protein